LSFADSSFLQVPWRVWLQLHGAQLVFVVRELYRRLHQWFLATPRGYSLS
jgi:hypothetical protein